MNNVKNIIIPHPAHHHTVNTPVQSTRNPHTQPCRHTHSTDKHLPKMYDTIFTNSRLYFARFKIKIQRPETSEL